jgi:hypothetical protein
LWGLQPERPSSDAVKTMPDADKPTVTHAWLFALKGGILSALAGTSFASNE